jgi:hypothetical protein
MHRLWRAVIFSSLLRPNEFMRLERIKRRFSRRTLSSPPLPAPASSGPTEQAPGEETGARNGNENQNQNEERDNVDPLNVSHIPLFLLYRLNTIDRQCPTNIAPSDVEQNNDETRRIEKPLVDALVQIPAPDRDDPSFPTPGSNKNWTLQEFLMRIQRKNTTSVRAPAKMVCNTSPEVAQVYAARGFRVGFSFVLFMLLSLLERGTTEICCIHAESQGKITDFDDRCSYRRRLSTVTCRHIFA